MALNWPSKSPNEYLDYTLNWSKPLGTDTIVASTWSISASDLTTNQNTFLASTTTIWLAAGTVNTTYTITNTITTAGGRIYVQDATLKVVSS